MKTYCQPHSISAGGCSDLRWQHLFQKQNLLLDLNKVLEPLSPLCWIPRGSAKGPSSLSSSFITAGAARPWSLCRAFGRSLGTASVLRGKDVHRLRLPGQPRAAVSKSRGAKPNRGGERRRKSPPEKQFSFLPRFPHFLSRSENIARHNSCAVNFAQVLRNMSLLNKQKVAGLFY